jgi:hypothetical protein
MKFGNEGSRIATTPRFPRFTTIQPSVSPAHDMCRTTLSIKPLSFHGLMSICPDFRHIVVYGWLDFKVVPMTECSTKQATKTHHLLSSFDLSICFPSHPSIYPKKSCPCPLSLKIFSDTGAFSHRTVTIHLNSFAQCILRTTSL